MDILHILHNRYATKQYDSSKIISQTDIATLQEVLQYSPSSINSQPWQFKFVSDKDTKQKLATVSYHNTEKILQASHIVVFYAMNNVAAFEADIATRLPEPAVAYYNTHLKPLHEAEIQAWFTHQVYVALGVFLTAAASMNIDSTPMEGIQCSAYDQIIPIENYKTVFAVALGYRDKDDFNQPSVRKKVRRSLKDLIR